MLRLATPPLCLFNGVIKTRVNVNKPNDIWEERDGTAERLNNGSTTFGTCMNVNDVWGVKCMINRPYYDTVNFPFSHYRYGVESLDGDLIIISPSASAEPQHIYRRLSNQRNVKREKTRAKKAKQQQQKDTGKQNRRSATVQRKVYICGIHFDGK